LHHKEVHQKLRGNKRIEEKAFMMKFKKMMHKKGQSSRKTKPKLRNYTIVVNQDIGSCLNVPHLKRKKKIPTTKKTKKEITNIV